MRSRLFLAAAAVCAAMFLSSLPGLAIEIVTIPQPNSDGTSSYQDPDAQAQGKFSNDQQDGTKVDGLGSFHFSVNSDQGWPGGSGYYYRPGASSQPGYGTSNAPGSE